MQIIVQSLVTTDNRCLSCVSALRNSLARNKFSHAFLLGFWWGDSLLHPRYLILGEWLFPASGSEWVGCELRGYDITHISVTQLSMSNGDRKNRKATPQLGVDRKQTLLHKRRLSPALFQRITFHLVYTSFASTGSTTPRED